MHVGTVLHQELHALQAPFLNGDVQGAVASVILICALGVDQRPGVARVPVDLQQRQDAGIGSIPKVQHGLHQACLPGGALCGRSEARGIRVLRPGAEGPCPSGGLDATRAWWEHSHDAGYYGSGDYHVCPRSYFQT